MTCSGLNHGGIVKEMFLLNTGEKKKKTSGNINDFSPCCYSSPIQNKSPSLYPDTSRYQAQTPSSCFSFCHWILVPSAGEGPWLLLLPTLLSMPSSQIPSFQVFQPVTMSSEVVVPGLTLPMTVYPLMPCCIPSCLLSLLICFLSFFPLRAYIFSQLPAQLKHQLK
jgi:hypothetical protein